MYPALAVLKTLEGSKVDNLPTFQSFNLQTIWIGGESGMEEELVKHAGIPFQTIPAAGLHGVGPRAFPRNLMTLDPRRPKPP